jgi:Tfp pilus assembly protein PilF
MMRVLVLIAAALTLAACMAGELEAPQPESMEASPANIASLTDVIRRNPNDPQGYNVRGTVFGRAGRYQEALADFDKALSLDPNYAQAYSNRALVHRQMKKFDLALADYNRAIAIDANYEPAYLGRGMLYREQGQATPAFEDFNKAIALKPANKEAYYNRGLLYQSQKQHNYAIGDFTTAIGLPPAQQVEPMVARALSYIATSDFKSAASDLDNAVEIDPQSLQAWTARGLAYERLGDKEKAAGSYARALGIRADYQPAKTGFARVGGRPGQSYSTF